MKISLWKILAVLTGRIQRGVGVKHTPVGQCAEAESLLKSFAEQPAKGVKHICKNKGFLSTGSFPG